MTLVEQISEAINGIQDYVYDEEVALEMAQAALSIIQPILDAKDAEIAELKKARVNKTVDYPECSGIQSDCPENEGYGCCQPPINNSYVKEGCEQFSGSEVFLDPVSKYTWRVRFNGVVQNCDFTSKGAAQILLSRLIKQSTMLSKESHHD